MLYVKKHPAILSLPIVAAFLAYLLFYHHRFAPEDTVQVAAEPVPQKEILTGRDEKRETAPEDLPDQSENPDQRININTADAETLETLPRVGAALSRAIIEYRESNGDFKSIEDIMNVPGIGQGRFNEISGSIKVSGD